MMWYQLKAAKMSAMGKGHQYAKAGDKVQLVSDHGRVLIVDNGAEKFPITINEVLPCAAPKENKQKSII